MRIGRASTSTLLTWMLLGLVFAACSSSPPLDGTATGSTSAGGAGTGTAGGDTGGFMSVTGAGGGATTGCSGDLRQVIDGSGNVITTCSPSEGCFEGQCIGACDAATKSHGNVGCDFVVSNPVSSSFLGRPCYAVFVANNWPKPVNIQVTRAGASFDVTKFGRVPNGTPDPAGWPPVPATGLGVGDVAVLFLAGNPSAQNLGNPLGCPVPQAVSGAVEIGSTNLGKAFHIAVDVPVSAYDVLPFGGAGSFAPSASLLLPTSAWGTNYVAATATRGWGPGRVWMQVVAAADGTKVDIAPTFDLTGGGGLVAAPKGQVTSVTLNAGEVAQWGPYSSPGEIAGSVIVSDKPVAVLGGNDYLCLQSADAYSGGCDATHQQLPPVDALGYDYPVAPYETRRLDLVDESIVYRIVGVVDDTVLTYDALVEVDDKKYGPSPKMINRGDVVDFEATGAFRITSDKTHPFYLSQHMSGSGLEQGSRPGALASKACGGGGSGPVIGTSLGDEEHVNVLPAEQFLSRYVFFTDPTYATTNLVVTRKKSKGAFHDVSIDCLGTIGGWKPIGSTGDIEYTSVDLSRGGVAVKSCKDGSHTAESAGAFGLVVWGLDCCASYAYPAGGNVSKLTNVVVPVIPK